MAEPSSTRSTASASTAPESRTHESSAQKQDRPVVELRERGGRIEARPIGTTERRYEDLSNRQLASAVERVSPEGSPGDPDVGPSGLRTALTIVGIFVVAAGALFILLFNVWAGVAMLLIGAVMVLVNPVLWTGIQRGRERAHAGHVVAQEEPGHLPLPTSERAPTDSLERFEHDPHRRDRVER
ncbi:MAG: hypothetical protein SFZ23_13565 [Planctomycetota bacterium]|nr:hypothetical protein [Planctomycetota bacterium]